MYSSMGTFALTVALSCCKYPDPSVLPSFWDANRDSWLMFAESVSEESA